MSMMTGTLTVYILIAIPAAMVMLINAAYDVHEDVKMERRVRPIEVIGPAILKVLFWPIAVLIWLFATKNKWQQ